SAPIDGRRRRRVDVHRRRGRGRQILVSSELTVGELLERAELGVTAVAGRAGLPRKVTVPRIQKPGLALTGWPEQLHPHRVLVLGGTEIEYLRDHATARELGIATLMASDPACIVVRRRLTPPDELDKPVARPGVPALAPEVL